ncbi:hypothetical protein M413DRAFT_446963 [Hebeloma cylindrosporum]|uniref:Uncharacterized protein n=1 Tax=Hebeloma cylindrosporum TaxID=76867 RepID=A0A0C2XP88_HEBCY|nr:hypothetical protein M413DRAFT_446963 [Hebeloma cylindrosporum h7]
MKFTIVATVSALLMASASLAYPTEFNEAEIYRRSGTLTCKQHNDQIVCPTVFHCVGGSIVAKPGVASRLVTLNQVCTTSRRCSCT